MADDARPAGRARRLAVKRIVGASSNQNAGDQPQPALCIGSGVSPRRTMPQASQVPAASVKTSGCGFDARDGRCRMAGSG